MVNVIYHIFHICVFHIKLSNTYHMSILESSVIAQDGDKKNTFDTLFESSQGLQTIPRELWATSNVLVTDL